MGCGQFARENAREFFDETFLAADPVVNLGRTIPEPVCLGERHVNAMSWKAWPL